MTFNRKNQLANLSKLYNSNENQVVVFYSDSDSDIHEIIKDFLRDKEFFYYRALQLSSDEQINQFRNSINKQLIKSVITEPGYYGALKAMMEAKCEKRVVVIDEFQHIIKYSNELVVEILKCISNKWGNQPVLFILLSSNAFFVENQMVEKLKETAYEIAGIIKLNELTFIDLMKHFSRFTKEELIVSYAILSGKSKRILAFNNNTTLKQNIIDTLLSEEGVLYKRGMNILPPELREHSVYNTILINIAKGNNKLSDLHKATGYERSKISVYLSNLMEHNLIEKIESFDTPGKENTIKGVYSIKDGLMLFFYRFIYPNVSELFLSDKEKFYKTRIEPYLCDFAKYAFKKVCFEYMSILNKMEKLPIKAESFGTWIGKLGNIDIVLSDNEDRNIICLCEYEKDNISYEDFEWLKFMVKQAKLSGDYYYLFSKKGFDERLLYIAESSDDLFLIDLSML